MNLFVIGLSHRSAPVEIRERMAFPQSNLGETTCYMLGATGLHEAAILSTCNRVEVYGLTSEVDQAARSLRQFLHTHHQLTESVDAHLYEFRDAACVRHLLEVVAGLDSMVVGETEILGQVKQAYAAAQQAGATGIALNRLFQKSFAAAKHIRSSTAITRGSTSIGNVAVELAEKIFRNLATSTVMVIGTGAMSETTAKALRSRGAGQLLVCSRSQERAQALAGQLDGRPISWDDWPVMFPSVDIVISATSAPHPIITREKLMPLMKARQQRPLFLIDIAVPRDAERACGDLDNVYLYDIDDMEQIAKQNRDAREREVSQCRELVEERVIRWMEWFTNSQESLAERYARSAQPPAPPPPTPQCPVRSDS